MTSRWGGAVLVICLDLVIKGRYHRQATEFNQNWKKWRFLLELTTHKDNFIATAVALKAHMVVMYFLGNCFFKCYLSKLQQFQLYFNLIHISSLLESG